MVAPPFQRASPAREKPDDAPAERSLWAASIVFALAAAWRPSGRRARAGTDLWGGPAAKGAGRERALRHEHLRLERRRGDGLHRFPPWAAPRSRACRSRCPRRGVAVVPAPAAVDGMGAFLYHLRSDSPVNAWSETFNDTPSGRFGTVRHGLPGLRLPRSRRRVVGRRRRRVVVHRRRPRAHERGRPVQPALGAVLHGRGHAFRRRRRHRRRADLRRPRLGRRSSRSPRSCPRRPRNRTSRCASACSPERGCRTPSRTTTSRATAAACRCPSRAAPSRRRPSSTPSRSRPPRAARRSPSPRRGRRRARTT